MSVEKCGNCKFWLAAPSSDDGLCRALAPSPLTAPDSITNAPTDRVFWPRVLWGDWCGAWATLGST